MPLNALTLTVTNGVVGRPFAGALGGKSTGTRLRVKEGSAPGFGVTNSVLSALSMPYENASVTINEYQPSTGESRDTTFTLNATRAALVSTVAADGSITYTGGGSGAAPTAQTGTASTSGVVYTVQRLLGSTSTLSLVAGSSGNLSINNTTGAISAASAIAVGASQTANVREASGGLAVEYPVVITGVNAAPAPGASFVTNPSISPTTGDANTVFTATNGTMNNGGVVTGQRWLFNGSSIGTGTTVTPGAPGTLVLENTGTGGVVATSSSVTVTAIAPTLDSISVSPAGPVIGTAYNGTVTGKTADSTLSLSGPGAAGLSANNATGAITGTPTTAGAVNITETLSGATNSPRTTNGVLTVAATATLNALTIAPSSSTVGSPYSGTIGNRTSGSTFALSGAGAPGLSVNNSTGAITGTPTASGPVNITETLAGASGSPRTTNGILNIVAAQAVALKTALVQNRVPTFHTGGGGTRTRCATRWPLIAGCDLSSLVVDMCATYMGDPGGNIATYNLVEMSIEDTATGTVVPVRFGGNRGVTVPSGTIRLPSDEIQASAFGLSQIPAGKLLHVKCILEIAAVGNTLPYSQRGTSDGGGAQVRWYDPAVTTSSSVDAPGAFTSTGTAVSTGSNGFCPIVRGRYVRPVTAFMGLGDSIMEITADSTPQVAGRAFFQKAMRNSTADGAWRPSLMAAKVGIQTAAITSSPFWKEYLDAVDVIISEPGTNDMSSWTVSTGQKDLSDLWAIPKAAGKEVYQTNWQPRTDSSDWTTQEGQTPRFNWTNGAVRDQLISWFATKVQDGTLSGVIDTLSATSFPGDGTLPADKTKWDTTTGRRTSDGTHPYGSTMESMAVPVRATIAKYPINGL